MLVILNLTQHPATPDQIADGVVDLLPEQRKLLTGWLTFDEKPTMSEVWSRATLIAQAAAGDSKSIGAVPRAYVAMIGGAPYLMAPLESRLKEYGITPVYSFSNRVSVEEMKEDGTVEKKNVFKHTGFVGLSTYYKREIRKERQNLRDKNTRFEEEK